MRKLIEDRHRMDHVGVMDSNHDAMGNDGIEDWKTKATISSETTPMKDPKKISSEDDTKISYSTLVDRIEKLESESKRKTKELEQRLRETERNLGISPLLSLMPWRSSTYAAGRSGSAQNTQDDDKTTETFKLSAGFYSILSTWEWNTKPFWASLFVFFLQITLLAVLIWDLIGVAPEGNILNLPGNVEFTVRIAQAVAVPIAVFKQEDLREGIYGLVAGMPHAYRGDIKFQSMTPGKWRFGYFLRFAQGFVSMFASFVLLMQAETVFDLLLNFLGIEFISDLDELSFRLAGLGYFGVTTRDCVNTISETEFRKDKEETDVATVTFSPSWCRKYANILAVFLIFIAMVACFIFYLQEQYRGDYLPSIIQVEFGDETLPYLGLFNGCYMIRGDESNAERHVFEQMGRSTLRGKLAYCNDDDGNWVLFSGNDDPCEKPIVSSGSTKTFDVLDTVESQWYTNTGLPLEYLQIYRVDNEPASCGSLELLDAARDSCLEIELDLDGRSSTFQKRQLSVSSEGKVFDAMMSHPIYVGADDRVVIFTGRRWVLANLGNIGSFWENTTTLLEDTGNEEFYEGLMNVKSEWILSISEPVDGVNDQGTPLGLQWYFPRDIGEESNTTAAFNFLPSDSTRPVGVVCATCSSKTNPCRYEGVCSDETGKCDCKNGASGKLCRERPSGDGICNAYFNTPEFGYDAGDCCASTCGVSACDNSRIAFPYGLDMLSKRQNQSRAVWFDSFLTPQATPKAFGYDECKDPDQAIFAIEITPSHWRSPDVESPFLTFLLGRDVDFDWVASFFCTIDNFLVTCDDKPYMDISSILVATIGDIEECPTYRQTFQVPYGASCEITYFNVMPTIGYQIPLIVKLFHGSDGAPIYEYESAIGDREKFGWEIPASKCITKAFSNGTKSIFDKSTIEGAAVNRLSTSGRAIEWCESYYEGDRDFFSERFALEAVLTVLDSTETIEGDSHHCRVPLVGEGFEIKCNTDDRVSTMDIQSNFYATNGTLAEILEFLPLLPQLQRLRIGGHILKGPIPVSEIANLQNLGDLWLYDGALKGTIPTEIGNLQKLEVIVLANNFLTGDIPSELFSLKKLNTISLVNNGLTGPAIPSELLALPNLTSYYASNNSLSGSIPNDMQKLPLLWLILDGNNMTGPIPAAIGTLELLVFLNLDNNLLTGTIPTEIGNLQALLGLGLSSNRLTKQIPSELGSLRLLEIIQLQDNDLTGRAISSEMLSLEGLKTFRVSNNRLTGSIPTGVEKLRKLVQLNLDSNLLTGITPTQIGNLQALTELTLFSNRLSGSIPSELANLSALELCDILDGNLNMTGGSVGICN